MTLDDIRTEPWSPAAAAPGPFLIVSGHDFRTPRKVNLHRFAEELRLRDKTRFFSVGFSLLSRLKGDARLRLWTRSNRIETVDGVDCLLWRTALHPFNLRHPLLDRAAEPLFKLYARALPEAFFDWVRTSRFILFESGLPVFLFESAKRANPAARFGYFASDDLAAIGCGRFLTRELHRTIASYDVVFSPSRRLAATFRAHAPAYYVPYGTDQSSATVEEPSPFATGLHAVTAGSSRFDPEFFEIAAEEFPEIVFHVISGGPRAARLNAPNIRLHGEMPVGDVLKFFRHAAFGIAPYDASTADLYLVESAQKLAQLGHLGTPAVCPHIAAGTVPGRFGYRPGDRASIVAAIRAALAAGPLAPQPAPSWSEVVDRLLAPERFVDARV